jgi:hypothetical protein
VKTRTIKIRNREYYLLQGIKGSGSMADAVNFVMKKNFPPEKPEIPVSIQCSTCDRQWCLLSRKPFRRFLVKFMGCNYWKNESAGFVPWGDIK